MLLEEPVGAQSVGAAHLDLSQLIIVLKYFVVNVVEELVQRCDAAADVLEVWIEGIVEPAVVLEVETVFCQDLDCCPDLLDALTHKIVCFFDLCGILKYLLNLKRITSLIHLAWSELLKLPFHIEHQLILDQFLYIILREAVVILIDVSDKCPFKIVN